MTSSEVASADMFGKFPMKPVPGPCFLFWHSRSGLDIAHTMADQDIDELMRQIEGTSVAPSTEGSSGGKKKRRNKKKKGGSGAQEGATDDKPADGDSTGASTCPIHYSMHLA